MIRQALVGHTGFVGSSLLHQRGFEACFNTRNICDIAGQSFGRIVCAGAPSTMWSANRNPEGDRANLDHLATQIEAAHADELVLISTIAVFDDMAAGYTEKRARYEADKAYGRHRRALEERLSARFRRCHIIRLPALFGPGIRKNFLFDLINPLPSFIAPEKYEYTAAQMSAAETGLLTRWYAHDEALDMWALDRPGLYASGDRLALTNAFARIGFLARNFTNSSSRYQFYDMTRLAGDIDRAVAKSLPLLNVCSEPLEAAVIAAALTGESFFNEGPPVIVEDVRSVHGALFGSTRPYLFGRDETLAAMRAFFDAERAA